MTNHTIKSINIVHKKILPKSWILLDGYHFNSDYQIRLKETCNLLIIDDYNHLNDYHCHILLNQNVSAKRYNYHCDNDTQLLLGTKYALLRKEFTQSNKKDSGYGNDNTKIFITLGGSDTEAMILKIIESLSLIQIVDFEVKIIIGPANKNVKKIEEKIRAMDARMRVLQGGLTKEKRHQEEQAEEKKKKKEEKLKKKEEKKSKKEE